MRTAQQAGRRVIRPCGNARPRLARGGAARHAGVMDRRYTGTGMPRSIAIVEDEPLIRANYLDALNRLGYAARGYATRDQANVGFAAQLPDLVIIDAQIGDGEDSGLELGRALRQRASSLPLIFLAANAADFDRLAGQPPHADDYLARNTSLRQLVARIAALFRRLDSLAVPPAPASVLNRAPLLLETERMQARWRGREVALTLTEFWLVHALVLRQDETRSHTQLMRAAELNADAGIVDAHIRRVRRKFEAADGQFKAIEQVGSKGWRWRA